MFKRILVPTDASENSRRALIKALEVARHFNAEVELFHVINLPQYMGYFTESYGVGISPEQIDQIGLETLQVTLKDIDMGDISVVRKYILGYPAHAILEEIKRDFDLVVMGSHGHGPIAGTLLGSVTQRVLAHTNCPVLVVK